ncbi:MAG: VWA domain-containing protein [Methanomicrobiales archaeon]|nr:VWA domain-containing protein [Methanomicrobiales archaeon]
MCLICLSCVAVPAAAESGVGVDPATITGTLKPGETQNAQIAVTLPGSVPKGDVVFVFDATASMSPVLQSMQVKGIQVMDNIRKVIPDTQFGAGSFMDYPNSYPGFYGYFGPYGCAACGDYAWRLDGDLTDDISSASDAINSILIGDGGDLPQDYTRVIYEARSYTWRPEAKKIYVIFGDAPPHAAPSGSSLFTQMTVSPYGGDPGRDEMPYTDDDLDYIPVVQETAAMHINIVGVYLPYGGTSWPAGNDAEVNFRYMADQTDGLYMVSDPNTDPTVFADQIVTKINEMAKQNIKELGLKLEESEYPGWVTTSEPYTDVSWPSTRIFNMAITPPAGTADGDYTLHIDVIGDGVVLGTVTVTEHVAGDQVVTPIDVPIDIKPGSCPNSFNIKEKGVLPVAILGGKNLKASAIDPKSILLARDGGTDGVKPIRSSLEDVASASTKTCSCGFKSGRPDRKQDLTLKFDSQEVVKTLGIKKNEGCIKVTVTGTLRSKDPALDGKQIQGSDYLRVLDTGAGPCGGGDSKDDKGSCDNKGSCDGGSGKDTGSSDERDRNPWDDSGTPDDHGHGNGNNRDS